MCVIVFVCARACVRVCARVCVCINFSGCNSSNFITLLTGCMHWLHASRSNHLPNTRFTFQNVSICIRF